MANILTKSAFQPIFGNPEPDVPAHAGIVRSRRGCRGQGSHAPYSKLKLSAKSQYLFYRTATDSKKKLRIFDKLSGTSHRHSRASEGRFHARPVILRHPVRRKAAFCHGNTSGRHRGLAKGGSPATGADCGELCGSLLAAPVAQPDILFLSQRSPCCAKTVSGMHRKSYLHDDE